MQSPDQAVKTWWRFYDINHAHNVESCLSRHRNNLSGPLKYVAQIAQGDVLRTLIPVTSLCRVSTYARDIQEVKTESETRAVVFANIKDVSPVPDGAEPDENDKKYRANGFRYKYVLEKTSAGWKISQVFQYRESMRNDPWLPVYEPFNKPLYPGFIHTQ